MTDKLKELSDKDLNKFDRYSPTDFELLIEEYKSLRDHHIAETSALIAKLKTWDRSYEYPTPPPVKPGDIIRNRITGQLGYVESVCQPNLPWHNGGQPMVLVNEKMDGCWHYYDLMPNSGHKWQVDQDETWCGACSDWINSFKGFKRGPCPAAPTRVPGTCDQCSPDFSCWGKYPSGCRKTKSHHAAPPLPLPKLSDENAAKAVVAEQKYQNFAKPKQKLADCGCPEPVYVAWDHMVTCSKYRAHDRYSCPGCPMHD